MQKSSYQISWKRIGIGVLISMIIFSFIFFLGWYFLIYQPQQELFERARKIEELYREFYIKKGLPLPDYLQ